MQRNHLDETHELIELGSVSGATKGNTGPHWEDGGLKIYGVGLSDE